MQQSSMERLAKAYEPLIRNFTTNLSDPDRYKGMPEPFLPVVGKKYDSAKIKVAFVGIETNGWDSLTEFLHDARNDAFTAYFRSQGDFDEFEFVKWTNNFQTSFFDYILRFLATLYSIGDWKDLKNRKHPEVLSSFSWCNTNAIERFKVTAQKKNVEQSIWQKVKSASLIFDHAALILKTLTPKLVVVTDWEAEQDWLVKDAGPFEGPDKIDQHIWYYYMKDTDSHVIQTAHPRFLAPNEGIEKNISKIMSVIRTKRIFSRLPANEDEIPNYFDAEYSAEDQSWSTLEYKRSYLLKLAKFLNSNKKKMSGYELVQHFNRNKILSGYGKEYQIGRGIFTLIRETYRWYEEHENALEDAKEISTAFVKENNEFAYDD